MKKRRGGGLGPARRLSLIACLRLGLRYVGYEINPCYYATARERIEAEKQLLTFLEQAGAG